MRQEPETYLGWPLPPATHELESRQKGLLVDSLRSDPCFLTIRSQDWALLALGVTSQSLKWWASPAAAEGALLWQLEGEHQEEEEECSGPGQPPSLEGTRPGSGCSDADGCLSGGGDAPTPLALAIQRPAGKSGPKGVPF